MSTSRINKIIINTTYSLFYIKGFTFIMIIYLLYRWLLGVGDSDRFLKVETPN